ncbi:MAG: hypothetical protein ACU837_15430 [Gammaproteobacteria bacterium]
MTGISTGALIAPFAFLGPKYDAKLKEVYTTSSAQDVLEERSLLAMQRKWVLRSASGAFM